MERSVEVVVSELQAASERLRDAGQRLQDGLSSVDLETRQLLGSGWKGGAASAYGPAWDKWHDGAGQVVRGLQTMADLLNLAGKEYAKTDEQSGEALNATVQIGGGAPVADLAQRRVDRARCRAPHGRGDEVAGRRGNGRDVFGPPRLAGAYRDHRRPARFRWFTVHGDH